MKRISIVCALLLLTVSLSTAQWANNQNASQVVGQTDYTSYGSNNTLATLGNPTAIAIDAANGKAYVVDQYQRVLRFNYPFSGSPITAEIEFGINNNGGPGRKVFNSPKSVAVYNNVLYVADAGDNRIVRFNSASTKTTSPNADGLIGQTDYNAGASGSASGTTVNNPQDIFIDGSGNLWVADYGNNRVLKFTNVNSKATDGTAAADLVLGQSDMNTGTAGAVSNTSLSNPTGVCVNGTTVWVVDKGYNRVLKYVNPTSDGFAATVALGQSNLNSSTVPGAVSQNQFKSPWDATIDGNGNLYVSESGDNRVMIFLNAASKSSGGDADYYLGQSSWTSSTSNAGQNGFNSPYGMTIDNGNSQLFVADLSDNRILRFTASSALPVELTSFTATANGSAVTLQWRTATEVNNYGFEIEQRTVNSKPSTVNDWQKVGFIAGAGMSNSPKEYSYSDTKPISGRSIYRLKQVDNGGMFKYSQSVEVEVGSIPKELSLHQNYPNPFNPITMIRYDLPQQATVKIAVYDMIGREVATLVNETKEAGSYEVNFAASQLASGVYFYKLSAGSYTSMKKLMLMK